MDLTLTEQLSYSTVRIECEDSSGNKSSGSGYFFRFKDNKETKQHIPVVITNKHVINGSQRGQLIFTKADSTGDPTDKDHFSFYIDNFESFWRKHPDPDVDLCAMPIAPFLQTAEKQSARLFYIPLDMSLLPTPEKLDDFQRLKM